MLFRSQKVDQLESKTVQLEQRNKKLREEAKSTEEKIKKIQDNEVELLTGHISLEEANNRLQSLIKERDKELAKFKEKECNTVYICNQVAKQKLLEYIEFRKEHSECSEKINDLNEKLMHAKGIQKSTSSTNDQFYRGNEMITAKNSISDDINAETMTDIIQITEKEYNNKSNKLKVNLKIMEFHGNEDENITNWIYNIESIFSISNINDDKEKVSYAKTYLRKIALTNYKAFESSKNYNVSWEDFKNHMYNKYRPLHHEETLRIKLREMKMDKSESIRNFINKFQQCIFEINNMSEKDKIFYFTTALQERTRIHLQLQSPKTLEEAIEMAEKYETFVFHNNNSNNKNIYATTKNVLMHRKGRSTFKKKYYHSNQNQQTKSKYVSYNKQKQHNTKNIYNNQKEVSKDIICFLCKEKGHIKSQCPQNKNKEPPVQTRRAAAYSLHVGNSNLKLLRYWAKLNKQRVGVVFDTAAECSLISKDCADRLQLNIHQSTTKIDEIGRAHV